MLPLFFGGCGSGLCLLLLVLRNFLAYLRGQPGVFHDNLRGNAARIRLRKLSQHLRNRSSDGRILHSLVNPDVELAKAQVIDALALVRLDQLLTFGAFDAKQQRSIHVLLNHREQHLRGVQSELPEVVEQ